MDESLENIAFICSCIHIEIPALFVCKKDVHKLCQEIKDFHGSCLVIYHHLDDRLAVEGNNFKH